MKKSYLLLGITCLLAACTGTQKEVREFTLTGTFANDNFNGKEIYLQEIDSTQKYISLDTAIVKNGTFVFKENISGKNNNLLFVSGNGIAKPLVFVAEKGNIEMAIDTSLVATIKGSPLNDKYQDYSNQKNIYNNLMQEVGKEAKVAEKANKLTPQLEKALDNKYDSIYNELRSFNFNFANTNIDNIVGEYVLLDRGRSFDEKQLGEIIPKVGNDIKKNPAFNLIEKRYNALKNTIVGNTFVDLKGDTPDGNIISLSDYAGKGKIVLIDFWASWCPPCRKEMPHVVKLYNQYKNKGFEIVGVSLDNDKASWVKGIKDLNITWPQMSDLKGWKTELGASYAVNSIPHMVLIDKNGKIIAKNINANDLETKLPELLK